MRILLLNLYYPPDTSATAKMAAVVADALSAQHEVTILCGRPSYDPAERRPWRFTQTERAGNIKIIRVGSTAHSRHRMTLRVLNYLTYVALAVPLALPIRCDVVLAMTDPPFEGIVGASIAMLKRKPYVYNIRDLYPDMALGGSIVQPGLLARVWETLHRWALRRAARVIVLGEDMRTRILAKGIDPQRVQVVRDGVELPVKDQALLPLDESVVRAIRNGFRFVLLHAGNLGFYGAWTTLIAAARALSANGDQNGIGLVFVGDGAQRAEIEASAKGLPNVRFLPFFPASKVGSVLRAADAHIISIKPGLEGVVVPSKLYGILAAGRPVLAVAPKETDPASLGAKQGFAISADPENPEEVAAAFRRLASDPACLAAMGAAAMSAAAAYDRVSELRKFLHIIEEARNA